MVANKGIESLSSGRKPNVLTIILIRHIVVELIGLEPITYPL